MRFELAHVLAKKAVQRRIGERLLADRFYDKAMYHFQQAVEKAVKAVVIGLGIFQKTHLVGAVLREVTLEEKRVPVRNRRG